VTPKGMTKYSKCPIQSSLPFIPFSNPNKVISVTEVELGKDDCALFGFEGRCDEWQGVLNSDGYLI